MKKIIISFLISIVFITTFSSLTLASSKNSLNSNNSNENSRWYNIKVLYTHDPVIGNNVKSYDQFLSHDLIYKISHSNYDLVKTELQNEEMAKKYKDKNIDIFGTNYYAYCYFSEDNMVEDNGKKTCMYGGITEREGNLVNNGEEGSLGIPIVVKVFIDGHQSFSYSITTNKINVTAQELDFKARRVLIAKKQIYDDIYNSGYIEFKEKNGESFRYDMYPPLGTTQSKYLMMYKDNKTVNSNNTEIEIHISSN